MSQDGTSQDPAACWKPGWEWGWAGSVELWGNKPGSDSFKS